MRLLQLLCRDDESPLPFPHTPVELHFLIMYAIIAHRMFAYGIHNLRSVPQTVHYGKDRGLLSSIKCYLATACFLIYYLFISSAYRLS